MIGTVTGVSWDVFVSQGVGLGGHSQFNWGAVNWGQAAFVGGIGGLSGLGVGCVLFSITCGAAAYSYANVYAPEILIGSMILGGGTLAYGAYSGDPNLMLIGAGLMAPGVSIFALQAGVSPWLVGLGNGVLGYVGCQGPRVMQYCIAGLQLEQLAVINDAIGAARASPYADLEHYYGRSAIGDQLIDNLIANRMGLPSTEMQFALSRQDAFTTLQMVRAGRLKIPESLALAAWEARNSASSLSEISPLLLTPQEFSQSGKAQNELIGMAKEFRIRQQAFGENLLHDLNIQAEVESILKRETIDEFVDGILAKSISRKGYIYIGQMDDIVRGRFNLNSWEEIEAVSEALAKQSQFPRLGNIVGPRRLIAGASITTTFHMTSTF